MTGKTMGHRLTYFAALALVMQTAAAQTAAKPESGLAPGVTIKVEVVEAAPDGRFVARCRISNGSDRGVSYVGYSPSSPWYRIQQWTDGRWVEHRVGWFCGTGLGRPELPSTESVAFFVRLPEAEHRTRVGLTVSHGDPRGAQSTIWSEPFELRAPSAVDRAATLKREGAFGFPQQEAQVVGL